MNPITVTQPSDLTDDTVIAAILETLERRPSCIGVTRWDLACVLAGNGHLVAPWISQAESGARTALAVGDQPGIPPEVLLAKLQQMLKAGLLDGCGCGCRGDFEVTTLTQLRHGPEAEPR